MEAPIAIFHSTLAETEILLSSFVHIPPTVYDNEEIPQPAKPES